MVTISLSPFLSRRAIALLLAVFVLSALSCFANTALLPVSATPYDHQMARIEPALLAAATDDGTTVSFDEVNRWVAELRGIPYGFSMQWRTPSEVAHDPVADCKGKSVTLYERMRAHGARDIRLVIGRRAPTSRVTHAWVEWSEGTHTYILDPTINWTACAAETLPSTSYVPYYAYTGTTKFRAATSDKLVAGL